MTLTGVRKLLAMVGEAIGVLLYFNCATVAAASIWPFWGVDAGAIHRNGPRLD
jgi:hypothetical protein